MGKSATFRGGKFEEKERKETCLFTQGEEVPVSAESTLQAIRGLLNWLP